MRKSPRSPSRRALVVANGQPFGSVGPVREADRDDRVRARSLESSQQGASSIWTRPRAAATAACTSPPISTSCSPWIRRGATERCSSRLRTAGRKGILGRFNRAGGSQDPTAAADFGDGFLMKDGYTVVWVGWQFDVAAAEPSRRRSRGQRARVASASRSFPTTSGPRSPLADLPRVSARQSRRSVRDA